MFFSTTNTEDISIVEMICPLCNHDSRVKLSRPIEFYSILLIFNFWVPRRKLFGTCGYCHNSFKIDNKQADGLYKSLEKNGVHKKSYLIRNIGSLAIAALLIFIISSIV